MTAFYIFYIFAACTVGIGLPYLQILEARRKRLEEATNNAKEVMEEMRKLLHDNGEKEEPEGNEYFRMVLKKGEDE